MGIDNEIKILEEKIANASARISQAEKQYKRSCEKLERQKQAIEIAKLDISRVKINIANQIFQLQKLREFRKKIVGV